MKSTVVKFSGLQRIAILGHNYVFGIALVYVCFIFTSIEFSIIMVAAFLWATLRTAIMFWLNDYYASTFTINESGVLVSSVRSGHSSISCSGITLLSSLPLPRTEQTLAKRIKFLFFVFVIGYFPPIYMLDDSGSHIKVPFWIFRPNLEKNPIIRAMFDAKPWGGTFQETVVQRDRLSFNVDNEKT